MYARMIRSTAVLAVAMIGLVAGASQAQTALKIGVFDPQRVSLESAQGKRLQAELNALQQTKQAELKTKDQMIVELEKTFNEQRLSLSTERRKEMELDIERRKLELQNARNLATQQLQLEFADAQQKFNDILIRGVSEFGRAEGFDLILDMGAVAWAGEKVDVTTAIIDLIDGMYPAGTRPEEAAEGD